MGGAHGCWSGCEWQWYESPKRFRHHTTKSVRACHAKGDARPKELRAACASDRAVKTGVISEGDNGEATRMSWHLLCLRHGLGETGLYSCTLGYIVDVDGRLYNCCAEEEVDLRFPVQRAHHLREHVA